MSQCPRLDETAAHVEVGRPSLLVTAAGTSWLDEMLWQLEKVAA
ncbi:hypothetical protein [Frankia sp. AgW1.1]|nr:hypothetical protein [Frankia sp. AgW1.1]